jgi:hypothetical protein
MQLPFLVASLELGSNPTNPYLEKAARIAARLPSQNISRRSTTAFEGVLAGLLHRPSVDRFSKRLFFVATEPLTGELALFEERQKRVSDVMNIVADEPLSSANLIQF